MANIPPSARQSEAPLSPSVKSSDSQENLDVKFISTRDMEFLQETLYFVVVRLIE